MGFTVGPGGATVQPNIGRTSMQLILPSEPVRLSLAKKSVAAAVQFTAGIVKRLGRTPRRSNPVVAIIEPHGMGDAVSLQPLVEGLLDTKVRLVICARSEWRGLFPPGVEWIDCRVPWSAYGDEEKYRPGPLLEAPFRQFLRELRAKAAGGIGIDTRGDARNMFLLSVAGCRRIFSLDHYLACDLRNSRWAANLLPYDETLRRWQLNAQFLGAVGATSERVAQRPQLRSRFVPPLPAREAMRVGLIPVAPWGGKAWPEAHWAELIRRLRTDGLEVSALCGPGQAEESARQLGGSVTVGVCNSIREWGEALTSLSRLVSVDTGPMHLADALDVPLVTLYGAGCLPLWAPSGPRSLALHRQDDPDYEPVHPTDAGITRGKELMARHSVEEVLAALRIVSTPT
jgi:ADP-heptose:LPS heptosyltransferase